MASYITYPKNIDTISARYCVDMINQLKNDDSKLEDIENDLRTLANRVSENFQRLNTVLQKYKKDKILDNTIIDTLIAYSNNEPATIEYKSQFSKRKL